MQTVENIVQCPYCGVQHINPLSSICPACGGNMPLSHHAPTHLAEKPPFPPRELSKKYIRRVKYTGNVFTMIGIIFTIPFFWSVIFPLIGIFLWRKGIRQANEELLPLQHGDSVQGEIESIEKDYATTLNGRHPYIITFIFEVKGQKYRGSLGNVYEEIDLRKNPGDKVWVVYMPEDPHLSSLWPPLQ